MVRYGFLIEDGKIYDTKIQSYVLKKQFCGNNVIYYMEPNYHKRLYLFEPLLTIYPEEKVFEILKMNTYLNKQRHHDSLLKTSKLHYVFNMSSIYNYPPTYLPARRFAIYKKIQSLKKRLE